MKFVKFECKECGSGFIRELNKPQTFLRVCPACEGSLTPSEFEIVNLLPHEVSWHNTGDDNVTNLHVFPKCDVPCRVAETIVTLDEYYPLPVNKKRMLGVQGLPEQQEKTYYIA